MSIRIGTIFRNCKIVDFNEEDFYLLSNQNSQWFDIILSRDCCLHIGDFLTVVVYSLKMSHDGMLQAMVRIINDDIESDSGYDSYLSIH